MKNIETDKIEYAKAVAQLKFSLIAPVVANTFTEVNATAYFKRISESEFEWPDGSKKSLHGKPSRTGIICIPDMG